MTNTLKLEVGVPPSLNNAYRNTHDRGGRALTEEGRAYKADVKMLAIVEAHRQRFKYPISARLGLMLRLYFDSNHRRDISNCVKLIEDALSSALGFDDYAVDRLLVERAGVDRLKPRCEVELEVLS